MKSLCLSLCLIVVGQRAIAELCSTAQADQPCTPDADEETEAAKKSIRDLIELAHTDDRLLRILEARYRAVRKNSNFTAEQQLAACSAYRIYKNDQDQLYREALDKTAALYHVFPNNSGYVSVAKSPDPKLRWISGLPAHWRPEVTNSGPGVKLAIKIIGTDAEDHYGGLANVNTDPRTSKGGPLYAVTLPDGRSFVLKGTFDLALDKKHGLGFLASVLFHETRHFNYLSRLCPSGSGTCSWASETEDERDAYAEQNRMAKVFGLTGDDKSAFITQWRAFDAEVKAGRLKSFNPDPGVEKKWAAYYPKQIDLESEYEDLKTEVANSHLASDQRLAASLRDIVLKDCANSDEAQVGEVENLPMAYDPHFFESVPGGLTTSCAFSLYSFIAHGYQENRRPTQFDIQKFLYDLQHPPTATPLSPSPSLAPPPPPARLAPVDPYWQARALYNLSWKACQPGAALTQEDFDALGVFPTGGDIPGAGKFESGLSGCWKSVFDRALAANRPGGQLTGPLLSQWAAETQPRQPPPYHHRDPDDAPQPHPIQHCVPQNPATPDVPGSCEEGYHQ